MIVIKFGGTSVGDADRVANAVAIVAKRQHLRPIVVVSALAGVTNELIAATEAAKAGNLDGVNKILDGVLMRHERVAMRLVQQKADFHENFLTKLHNELAAARTILHGMCLTHEITLRTRDFVTAIGEKLSSVLFAYSMRMHTLPSEAVEVELIQTDDHFGEASPDMEKTRKNAREILLPLVERHVIPVMGGFIGRTEDGATTTLGRGGSDYSAAIIGAAVGAEEIQIWTDVDGMMTCDPRLISGARVIDRIAYDEAAELAWFGAKVLHPKTIAPAVGLNIPVRVLNTHNVASPGTVITRDGDDRGAGARAVAVKRNIAVVHMTSNKMLGAHGFLAHIFAIFRDLKISVDLITTSEVSVSVTIDDKENLPALKEKLVDVDVRIDDNQSIIAVVGRNLMGESMVGPAIFDALQGVPLTMFSLGRSGLNLSIVVEDRDADRAIKSIHHALFEAPVCA
jgi:aspartate kinase